ncbi:unnamed protein product [Urochloa humidicola]
MALDVDYHQYLPSPHLLARCIESKPYWSSPTCGFTRIPDGATSNRDMFPHYYDKLCVLKLSGCTFDLQSPAPFLCCHNLRFLWIDHCKDNGTNRYGARMEEDVARRRCFQRLWVLEVRYTSCDQILSAHTLDLMTQLRELNVMGAEGWDMGQLQGRLPNIRKLRVTMSNVTSGCPENDLLSDMNKMELLEFSGNTAASTMASLIGPGAINNNSCLETVIIDIVYWLGHISFRGCTELKNLLLKGWTSIRTLDISGTSVKTLDLTETTIWDLNELYLLGCEKLCAILWPPENKRPRDLAKLCIGTTQTTPTAQYRKEEDNRSRATRTSGELVLRSDRPTSEFDWYISVMDARLLVSLGPVYSSREAYVEVSSPTTAGGGSKDEGVKSGSSSHEQVKLQRHPAPTLYADITVNNLQQQAGEDDDYAGCIMWTWPCRGAPPLPQRSCYMHIQDTMTRTELSLPQGGGQTSGTTIAIPQFINNYAKILHVHNSLSITRTPSGGEYGSSQWPHLEWCRIERCPNLEFVFYTNEVYVDSYNLRTFWVSQLLKSRYIFKLSRGYRVFPDLTFLHLDLCPRLIHVLPMWKDSVNTFSLLEILEIVWCGDLREIFPLQTSVEPFQTHVDKSITREFTALKHIHLHELPSLQSICGARMFAPNLETVKIRGCWSLTRLPDVGSGDKAVECDCEKEWWDRLEWDDGSQASRYKPIHSRYYKKTLLRGSVLR